MKTTINLDKNFGINKSLEEAQKDRNIASFNNNLYMLMLHQPKYNFEIVRL